MEYSIADRNHTFRQHEDPQRASPTKESYGFDRRRLNVSLSNLVREVDSYDFSLDLDGVFGHFHLRLFAEAIKSPVLTLMKTSILENLESSKYLYCVGNERLEAVDSMQALKIGHITTNVLGEIKLYLIWPAERETILDVKNLMRKILMSDCCEDTHHQCRAKKDWEFMMMASPLESSFNTTLAKPCYGCFQARLISVLRQLNMHHDCRFYVTCYDMKIATRNWTADEIDSEVERYLEPSAFPCEFDVGSQYSATRNGRPLTLSWSPLSFEIFERLFKTRFNKYHLFLVNDFVCGQFKNVSNQCGTIVGTLVGENDDDKITVHAANIYGAIKNIAVKGKESACSGLNLSGKLMNTEMGTRYTSCVSEVKEKFLKRMKILYAHLDQIGGAPHGNRLELTIPFHQLRNCHNFLRRLWGGLSDIPEAIFAIDSEEFESMVKLQIRLFEVPVLKNLEVLERTIPGSNSISLIRDSVFTVAVFLDLLSGVTITGKTFGHTQGFVFNRPRVNDRVIQPCTLDGRRCITAFNHLIFCWRGPNGTVEGPFDPATYRFNSGWLGLAEFSDLFEKMITSLSLALPPKAATQALLRMQAHQYLNKAQNDPDMMAVVVIKSYCRHISDMLGLDSRGKISLDSKLRLNRAFMEEMDDFEEEDHCFLVADESLVECLSKRLTSQTKGIKKGSSLHTILLCFEKACRDKSAINANEPTAMKRLASAFVALDFDTVHVIGPGRSYLGSRQNFLHIPNRIGPIDDTRHIPLTQVESRELQTEDATIKRAAGHHPWTYIERVHLVLGTILPCCKKATGKIDWGRVKLLSGIFKNKRTRCSLSGHIKRGTHEPAHQSELDSIRSLLIDARVNSFSQLPSAADAQMVYFDEGGLRRFIRMKLQGRPNQETFDQRAFQRKISNFFALPERSETLRSPMTDQAFVSTVGIRFRATDLVEFRTDGAFFPFALPGEIVKFNLDDLILDDDELYSSDFDDSEAASTDHDTSSSGESYSGVTDESDQFSEQERPVRRERNRPLLPIASQSREEMHETSSDESYDEYLGDSCGVYSKPDLPSDNFNENIFENHSAMWRFLSTGGAPVYYRQDADGLLYIPDNESIPMDTTNENLSNELENNICAGGRVLQIAPEIPIQTECIVEVIPFNVDKCHPLETGSACDQDTSSVDFIESITDSQWLRTVARIIAFPEESVTLTALINPFSTKDRKIWAAVLPNILEALKSRLILAPVNRQGAMVFLRPTFDVLDRMHVLQMPQLSTQMMKRWEAFSHLARVSTTKLKKRRITETSLKFAFSGTSRELISDAVNDFIEILDIFNHIDPEGKLKSTDLDEILSSLRIYLAESFGINI